MIRFVFLVMLSALVGASAHAAPANAEELAKLHAEVAQLNAQQQQILAALEDLKKMVRGRGQPALKPPQSLSVAEEPFKGEPAARVALVEYADLQCPFCRRFDREVYPRIRDSYINTGKLKFFHRDMPLGFHEGALPAARAVHCAAEQNKYWEMHDSLLVDTASLTAADIDARAAQLGLNVAELDKCISSNRFADVIQRSVAEANEMQISGTPTFLIGTLDAAGNVVSVQKTVVGAAPFESFKAALEPLLTAAR
jgi:protein-disulfide isomerase